MPAATRRTWTLTAADVPRLAERRAQVREQLDAHAARAGRAAGDVAIVTAVKYVDAASVPHLVAAGHDQLGENRDDQLRAKREAVAAADGEVSWHYIGRLQSRRAPAVAGLADMVHTLCTDSAARRLAQAAAEVRLPELLVQVNVDGDPAKDGIAPADVERFLASLPEPVRVSGFMTMPALAREPDDSRGAFAALRELLERLAPRLSGRHDLRVLSMGTSQDWGVAAEEGATHVRLGTVLYEEQG